MNRHSIYPIFLRQHVILIEKIESHVICSRQFVIMESAENEDYNVLLVEYKILFHILDFTIERNRNYEIYSY